MNMVPAEVATAAQDAIAEHGRGAGGIIRFSECFIPGRKGPTKGWRWVSTDRAATVRFLLACWNNRDALALNPPH